VKCFCNSFLFHLIVLIWLSFSVYKHDWKLFILRQGVLTDTALLKERCIITVCLQTKTSKPVPGGYLWTTPSTIIFKQCPTLYTTNWPMCHICIWVITCLSTLPCHFNSPNHVNDMAQCHDNTYRRLDGRTPIYRLPYQKADLTVARTDLIFCVFPFAYWSIWDWCLPYL